MSEIGGDSDDSRETGGGGEEISENSTETSEVSGAAETGPGAETPEVSDSNTGEVISEKSGMEAAEGKETGGLEDVSSAEPDSPGLKEAQNIVGEFHQQSISQILEQNGKYMSPQDLERVTNGIGSIKAIEHDPNQNRTGRYIYYNGKSYAEISAINLEQMERTVKHESNHFASKNREIIVPCPDKGGYMMYNMVGTRQSSWFHNNRTGENSEYSERGRGLNEGLTTLYTNQQLMELSEEKGRTAEQQQIYAHATELCGQLEEILGEDSLKEAYYGGNLQGLEEKVDELAGEKEYQYLRDCLDKTISEDYAERVEAMKEAQQILAKMNERSKKS